MYKWPAWEIGLLAVVAAVVLGLFTIPENFGFPLLAKHPEARQAVALAYFAPKEIVHCNPDQRSANGSTARERLAIRSGRRPDGRGGRGVDRGRLAARDVASHLERD